ncbi:MAG: hypothetical protein IT343_01730 [Candidatus Melainabacteria bacterium]|jgi:hypothetical protein|nr:hypothetical protein [Candidatus Melainabacteria bacterium]
MVRNELKLLKVLLTCILVNLASMPITLAAPVNTAQQLSSSNLQHGEWQLKCLLRVRPEMKTFITYRDPLWQWSAKQFAGEGCGRRIYWDSSPTHNKYASEAAFDEDKQQILIRLQTVDHRGNHVPPEEQWTSLVYAFARSGTLLESEKIWIQATKKQISKSDWIKRKAEMEFDGYVKTKKFYEEIFHPLMQKRKISSNVRFWRTELATTFQDWLKTAQGKECIQKLTPLAP